ncbi:hypothetical protein Salat_2275700 [Sesamum alatum]|uniref:C2 domain-containing protein n=1 Tax=Sesamum alatum TaxID=300844 RepID=A0AAE1XV59_9LAMI|nr:hypothetical protein Salat_2275700 [Sesamum alatum]
MSNVVRSRSAHKLFDKVTKRRPASQTSPNCKANISLCRKRLNLVEPFEYFNQNDLLKSWTSKISSLVKEYRPEEAMCLFKAMLVNEQRPNFVTVLSVIRAVGLLGSRDLVIKLDQLCPCCGAEKDTEDTPLVVCQLQGCKCYIPTYCIVRHFEVAMRMSHVHGSSSRIQGAQHIMLLFNVALKYAEARLHQFYQWYFAPAGNPNKIYWNEKFTFELPPSELETLSHLKLKIVNEEYFTDGEFVGETIIFLKGIIVESNYKGLVELKPAPFNVVLEDDTYKGQITIGLKFIPNTVLQLKRKQRVQAERDIDESICRMVVRFWEMLWWGHLFSNKHKEN